MSSSSAQFAIIGAGLAGAATAHALVRAGAGEVAVLEQEAVPGVHSSGRNAAIVRRLTGDVFISKLARRGADFIAGPQEGWSEPVPFTPSGLLLVGEERALDSLQEVTGRRTCAELGVERWSVERCTGRVPLVARARIEGGLWCPRDGVVDVAALLGGYLREARRGGAEVRLADPVRAMERTGDAWTVHTDRGAITARTVVNAAGPWARDVGAMAGAIEIPVRPHRRHLFATPPMPEVKPSWPTVWEVTEDFYFRPESHGLLLSPCDEERFPPGIPPVDAAITDELQRKLRMLFPAFGDLAILRQWAGLRTFTPDRRFVVGWDSRAAGFFWVAGLGGHGVTTSAAVGDLAARMLLGERPLDGWHVSPDRFAP